MNNFVFLRGESLFITFIASFLLWLMVLVLIFLFFKKKISRKVFFKILLTFVVSYLVSEGLKYVFSTPRPFKINGYPPLTITIPHSNAFPSSHTSAAVSLAVALLFFKRDLGLAFLLGALAVASGRIMANVHSLWDILGGAFVGVLSSFFVEKIIYRKK